MRPPTLLWLLLRAFYAWPYYKCTLPTTIHMFDTGRAARQNTKKDLSAFWASLVWSETHFDFSALAFGAGGAVSH